jgi:hypothetical protein
VGVITPKEAVTKQRSEKCPTLGLDELLQAAKEALALFERKGDVPDAARTPSVAPVRRGGSAPVILLHTASRRPSSNEPGWTTAMAPSLFRIGTEIHRGVRLRER